MLAHVTYLPLPALCNTVAAGRRISFMEREDGSHNKTRVVSAAVRRFPQFELTVHRLLNRDETFRDMCEELVEAELALSSVEQLGPELREARRAEWQEVVDRWVEEIGAALNAEVAKIPGLPGRVRMPPHSLPKK